MSRREITRDRTPNSRGSARTKTQRKPPPDPGGDRTVGQKPLRSIKAADKIKELRKKQQEEMGSFVQWSDMEGDKWIVCDIPEEEDLFFEEYEGREYESFMARRVVWLEGENVIREGEQVKVPIRTKLKHAIWGGTTQKGNTVDPVAYDDDLYVSMSGHWQKDSKSFHNLTVDFEGAGGQYEEIMEGGSWSEES